MSNVIPFPQPPSPTLYVTVSLDDLVLLDLNDEDCEIIADEQVYEMLLDSLGQITDKVGQLLSLAQEAKKEGQPANDG